ALPVFTETVDFLQRVADEVLDGRLTATAVDRLRYAASIADRHVDFLTSSDRFLTQLQELPGGRAENGTPSETAAAREETQARADAENSIVQTQRQLRMLQAEVLDLAQERAAMDHELGSFRKRVREEAANAERDAIGFLAESTLLRAMISGGKSADAEPT